MILRVIQKVTSTDVIIEHDPQHQDALAVHNPNTTKGLVKVFAKTAHSY